MSRVLIKEGGDAQTLGGIYVTVAQAIMIYGLETWVMTPHIRMVWEDSTTGWPTG